MRKAAGIILIVLGGGILVGAIINVRSLVGNVVPPSSFVSLMLSAVFHGIVYGGLPLAGGVFCLKRTYWGLCLVSALLTFVVTIPTVVAMLQYASYYSFDFIPFWENWIMTVGALISTIFISLRKKEWQGFLDSVDGKVSNGG
jgi:hypothetical protein